MICEALLIDGLSDQEVRALFNAVRDEDYAAVAKEARVLAETPVLEMTAMQRTEARARLTKLKGRAQEIVAIDFYGANGRETVDGLLTMLDASVQEDQAMEPSQNEKKGFQTGALKARVWVHVDRIASAWLIRRFIDADARFKFVRGKYYVPAPGELRFDMFEAEFTHEGDRCTFEVLLSRIALDDLALRAISEIVHDIDLKNGKFAREETSGIAHLIAGLTMAHKIDEQRMSRAQGCLTVFTTISAGSAADVLAWRQPVPAGWPRHFLPSSHPRSSRQPPTRSNPTIRHKVRRR
jgi:hypothetical protein